MTFEDFSPVENLMREVGASLLEWRSDPQQREVLAPAEFKTVADLRAHEHIANTLARIFPGLPVLSEEEVWTDARPADYWLIDPIDGTASWYEGFSGFVTQASLIRQGEPVYGIVHAPALGTTWEGVKLLDSWSARRNGDSLPRLQSSERLLLCDNYPQPRGVAQFLNEALPVTGYVESGSLGLKCCLIADGTADLFVKSVVVRDWDIAPAAPVVAGTGGILCRPDGAAYLFTGPMDKPNGVMVARDQSLAQLAIEALSKKGR